MIPFADLCLSMLHHSKDKVNNKNLFKIINNYIKLNDHF